MLSIKLFPVSVALLFVLVQSKHGNSLFRYRTETNVLFLIVTETSFGSSFGYFESKLVSKDILLKTRKRMASCSRDNLLCATLFFSLEEQKKK
jgi:hypothetical protein